MTQEAMFLRALRAEPLDPLTWLAYADWLEEQGDPRAKFIRVHEKFRKLQEGEPGFISLRAQLEKLRPQIDPAWQAELGLLRAREHDARVERCEMFTFQCPKRWNDLRATEDEEIRYCQDCLTHVYHCSTPEEALQHGKAGHCVALEQVDEYGDSGEMMGSISISVDY